MDRDQWWLVARDVTLGVAVVLLLTVPVAWPRGDAQRAPAPTPELPGSPVRQPRCPAPLAGEEVTIHVRVVGGELVAGCVTTRRIP